MPEDEARNYKFVKNIGTGAFGEVSEVMELRADDVSGESRDHNESPRRFAMKKLKLDLLDAQSNYIMRKVKNIIVLPKHENVVKLHDIFCGTDHNVIIVMELCDCDVPKFLWQNRRQKKLTEEVQLRILLQCARGVYFLHSSKPPIIHRDIKPSNFLVQLKGNNTFVVKMTEFRISASGEKRRTVTSMAAFASAVAAGSVAVHGTGVLRSQRRIRVNERRDIRQRNCRHLRARAGLCLRHRLRNGKERIW